MRRKIIIALIITIIAIASLTVYLNAVYLPVKIKSLIISTIEKQLGRKASLEGLRYNLSKGIVINNLIVYDGDGLEEKPFIAIKELSFNLLYLPIFKSKTVIIPSIKIDSAEINIIRLEENNFNFSSLLDKLNSSPPRLSVFIYKLNVLNARLNFIDQNFDPALSYIIPNLNCLTNFSLPKNIKFNLEAKLSPATTASLLLARGDYSLIHRTLETDAALHNIDLLQFKPYYNFSELKSAFVPLANFKITGVENNLSITSDIDLKGIGIEKAPYSVKAEGILKQRTSFNPLQPESFSSEGSFKITKARIDGINLSQSIPEIRGVIDFNAKKDNLSLASNLEFQGADIKKSPYSFEGDGLLKHRLSFNPLQPDEFSSEGSLEIANARLEGINLLQEIQEIKGTLDFKQEEVKTENLQGVTKGNLIRIKGGVSDFTSPQIAVKLYASPTLESLGEIFAEQLKDFDFEADGKTQLILEVKGPLNDPSGLDIKGAGNISEGILALPQLPGPLTDLNGNIEFDKDSIRWKKLYAEYAGTIYLSDGLLNNFANPHLELTMGSKLLSLSAELDIRGKNLKLSQLEGKYLNTLFGFTGEAGLSNPRNPLLDLRGNINLSLEDLAQMLPNYRGRINNLKPEGWVLIDASLQGNLNNRRDWQVSLKANSPQIAVQGLKLNDLNVRCVKQGEALKFILSAISYSGTINASGDCSALTGDLPCSVSADIKEIDLAKLKLNTPFKNKPTAGKLSLSAQAQGPLKKIRDLRGNGRVDLTEGNIWELNFLQGLGNFLFIPEFARIILREAQGNFVLRNGVIYTDALELKSDRMDLICSGNMDFSGKLDFNINAELNPEVLQDSASLKKFLTTILLDSYGILTLKLSGDVRNPKFSVVPPTKDIIKRVTDFFTKDILR